jgi:pyruvate kinase
MFKKTKVAATISDLNCEVELIKSLFMAGLNVVRLNTMHMDREGALKIIINVRQVSDRIAIFFDTKGLEGRNIRTLAAYWGKNLIIAQSYSQRSMRELSLMQIGTIAEFENMNYC